MAIDMNLYLLILIGWFSLSFGILYVLTGRYLTTVSDAMACRPFSQLCADPSSIPRISPLICFQKEDYLL